MKTNFLAKHKWWILAIVLMIALMAVSVSYSAWDTLSVSLNDKLANNGSGDFKEKAVWSDHIKLVEDIYLPDNVLGKNDKIDVGDIVTYGNFYQDADAVGAGGTGGTGVEKPQRWIVVNIDKDNVATLLSEKVVVYGNYWGSGGSYLNDYYRSTVRSWLNSGKGSLKVSGTGWDDSAKGRYNDDVRNDGLNGGKPFGNGNQVNQGFLDGAFTIQEQSILVPKKITGMQYALQPDNFNIPCQTNGNSPDKSIINDLVWLPSYNELYGSNCEGTQMDDKLDKHFKYFSTNTSNSLKIAGATNYAWNASSSSYFNGNGGGSPNGVQKPTDSNNDGIMDIGTWWWLRSPRPSYCNLSLIVNTDGSGSSSGMHITNGGVRPAVCVQL